MPKEIKDDNEGTPASTAGFDAFKKLLEIARNSLKDPNIKPELSVPKEVSQKPQSSKKY